MQRGRSSTFIDSLKKKSLNLERAFDQFSFSLKLETLSLPFRSKQNKTVQLKDGIFRTMSVFNSCAVQVFLEIFFKK